MDSLMLRAMPVYSFPLFIFHFFFRCSPKMTWAKSRFAFQKLSSSPITFATRSTGPHAVLNAGTSPRIASIGTLQVTCSKDLNLNNLGRSKVF